MTRRNWKEGWVAPLHGTVTAILYQLVSFIGYRWLKMVECYVLWIWLEAVFKYCRYDPCIWLKALRNKSREGSTDTKVLTGYLQNWSQTHRCRKISRDQMIIDGRLERSWMDAIVDYYKISQHLFQKNSENLVLRVRIYETTLDAWHWELNPRSHYWVQEYSPCEYTDLASRYETGRSVEH
jgi:hypothetical protein